MRKTHRPSGLPAANIRLDPPVDRPEWDTLTVRLRKKHKKWFVWALRVLGTNANAHVSNAILDELPNLIKRAQSRRARIVGKLLT